MKLFRKETKQITVHNTVFQYVVNETPNNESVSLKIYSSKTSYFEVLFSWEGNYRINLHRPNTCAKIIKYSIEHGWDYSQGNNKIKVEQGDFLIAKLGLDK
ncbi:hypothetical protein [Marinicrinis sediminis]|uniref:DUF2442 domain-containing protein n=1 Tax=Marinicrinis sediminis TaxID=1652465 RepID=A0ABW5RAX2_9BACL